MSDCDSDLGMGVPVLALGVRRAEGEGCITGYGGEAGRKLCDRVWDRSRMEAVLQGIAVKQEGSYVTGYGTTKAGGGAEEFSEAGLDLKDGRGSKLQGVLLASCDRDSKGTSDWHWPPLHSDSSALPPPPLPPRWP